jgi:hypothetical protein
MYGSLEKTTSGPVGSVQIRQPLRPQVSRDQLAGAGVDEHHQLPAALGGPVDHEAVTEVWWIEASDDQARRR